MVFINCMYTRYAKRSLIWSPLWCDYEFIIMLFHLLFSCCLCKKEHFNSNCNVLYYCNYLALSTFNKSAVFSSSYQFKHVKVIFIEFWCSRIFVVSSKATLKYSFFISIIILHNVLQNHKHLCYVFMTVLY